MTQIIKAHYDGRVIVPDEPVQLPVGQALRVHLEVPESPEASSGAEAWRQCILDTAGKWQGDFERPPQGEYEEREPLS